ncbi:MAG TPA: helix-hairpin-helix domain-containing protein [Thermodesulfobacteriota bacterium]|nr:helix-hairpin-helix domain-containing protein [Thermodesulfobacteriota bacterium]
MKYFSPQQQWILFALALVLLGTFFLKFYWHLPPVPTLSSAKEVVVEVSGEVRQPGVFLYQASPSLGDAVKRAGGLKEALQIDSTSSSAMLETGTLLTVTREFSRIHPPLLSPSPPSQAQATTREEIKIRIGRMAANKLFVFSIPLDLNHVSFQDLCLISGIGESLARQIIAYRERRKGFRSVEELRKVKGIGEKKYETLKKCLEVRR